MLKLLILILIATINANNESSNKVIENKNFDLEDPVPEEFYASDDNEEFKNDENNSSITISNFQCSRNKLDKVMDFNVKNEMKLLNYAVERKKQMLVFYILITKSSKQREAIISNYKKTYGTKGWNHLKNSGSIFWRTMQTVIEALITQKEEYSVMMLHKRFEFMTRSSAKLDRIIPECFKSFFKTKSKKFNYYMLTEILLESSYEERKLLKEAYFAVYKENLETTIRNKLNDKSSNFHLMLLNNKRSARMSDIESTKLVLNEAIQKLLEIKSTKSKKDKKEKLMNIVTTYPIEILTESIRVLKHSYNFSFLDINGKPCIKMSTLGMTVKYLDDPYAYYANNIKILIDQHGFSYYLSRVFFVFSKSKLNIIAETFSKLFNVKLKTYIEYRLKGLNSGKIAKMSGYLSAYSYYLKAILASFGEFDCYGDCRITNKN